MLKNQGKYYLFVGFILIFLLSGIEILFAQSKPIDFFGMKGERFTHNYIDKNDSLSAQEIIELKNEKGLAIWFGRDFQKIVCLSGLCRKVHLKLFWDGCGNYLGFQEHPDDHLTKTDHAVFNSEDYLKLHQILSDSVSVLKDLMQEDLIVRTEKDDENLNIDAISGATQASLKEYLVGNAAYTCYTLWHTVYGNTRKEILNILDQKVDCRYLQLLFNEDNPGYQIWAIIFIKKHPKYNTVFYPQIINLIKSNNAYLSRQALNYFSQQQLSDVNLQKKLLQIFEEISYQEKLELIRKLAYVPKVDDESILYLLDLFAEHRINVSLLGYTYKLIHSDNLKNPKVIVKLDTFSKDENMYVRNITNKLLAEVSVGN